MTEGSLRKGRYTRLSNKIGLVDSKTGGFISNSPEVVLNFPFKDTVLEAGMTKEDAGREERFLHTEIDAKDIDTLFDPKVLTDFRYIDKDGERKLTKDDNIEFFDKNGDLKQNLLIKGNNLLALYTLREKLAGKVKLIFIDPPYNTDSDGFKYNDAFNHASWLTFMKNRLEIAKELLSPDGAIYVSLDYHEVHYAKVLMDEVFGRENFQREIIWRIGWLSGYKTADNNWIRNHDTILFYSKNAERLVFNKIYIQNSEFKEIIKKEKIAGDLKNRLGIPEDQINEIVDIINHSSRPDKYPIEDVWNGNEYDDLNSIAIVSFAGETVSKLLNDKTKEIKGQKSEKLLKRIIQAHIVDPNEIVLDFCLGSGSTAAVAQKLNCRWIGIEQMDYIETIAKERLMKVVSGEQSGISKDVNWQGGGSFVYFELKKYNQDFIDRIMEAASIPELEEIYEDMQKNAFFKFWFDKKEFEKDEKFRKLDIDGRKQALVDILDENQFYLNYDEMEDSKYHVTENEKALTNRFYQESDKPEELENAEE